MSLKKRSQGATLTASGPGSPGWFDNEDSYERDAFRHKIFLKSLALNPTTSHAVLVLSILQGATFLLQCVNDRAPYLPGQDEVLLAPTPYTNYIWIPIYLGFIAYGIYQDTPQGRQSRLCYLIRNSTLFGFLGLAFWPLAILSGVGWLQIVFSFFLTYLPVHIAYLRIVDYRPECLTKLEYFVVFAPFALAAGWINCDTFINMATVAKGYGWLSTFALEDATSVSLLASAGGSAILLVTFARGEPIFTLTVLYALAGTIVSNTTATVAHPGASVSLVALSWTLIIFITGTTVGSVVRNKMEPKDKQE